jgi:hypothetical protein
MGGTSDYHAPVALPGGRELLGQFVQVVGQQIENGWILGALILERTGDGGGCRKRPDKDNVSPTTSSVRLAR